MPDATKPGSDEIDLTLWLRPREGGGLAVERAIELGRTLPGKRSYLTRAELDARHGPDPAHVEAICAVLSGYGLRKIRQCWRALRVRGTLRAASEFLAEIYSAKSAREGDARELAGDDPYSGALFLAQSVVAIFGPTCSTEPARRRSVKPHPETGGASPIGAQTIARHYSLPPGLDGSGQTIGMVEFGGAFDRADFEASMKAAGVPPCVVTSEAVDMLDAAPEFDDEVAIDTQVAGAFAPGARIKLYFAENSKRGWLDALVTALADERDAPSIVSISYGQRESSFSTAEIACFEEVFVAAALVGMTVIVASGDSGPTYGGADGRLEVGYPASSRFVLACGGTELPSAGTRITRERVWNAAQGMLTGGGFSARHPLPAWQRRPLRAALKRYRDRYAAEQGRGTPDLVAMADPGFTVVRAGVKAAGGGTSAVAPFIAALVARINQRLDGAQAGLFTPLLYEQGEERQVFREIRLGDIWPFRPSGGWDPSVGLGAPKGSELMQLLTG
jgi:kumamolisin